MMARTFLFLVLVFAMGFPTLAADEFILRATPEELQQLVTGVGLTPLKQIPDQDVYLVRGPDGVPPEEVIRRVRAYSDDDDDDDGISIEINQVVPLTEPETDGAPLTGDTAAVAAALQDTSQTTLQGDTVWSGYAGQPALSLIRVPETRPLATGAGVVAVIDTGIDPEHPVLRNWLVPGYDFIRDVAGTPSELEDLDPETRSILSPYTTAILDFAGTVNPYTTAILDQTTAARLDPGRLPPHFGHGTMVAGLVHLVAPSARIMALKPFGGDGKGTLFNILRAIYYAESNGAKVINMSLSLPAPSIELQRAVEFVAQRGAISVASAGNRGLETMVFPAGYQEVIGVASTGLTDTPSPFTNYGGNLVTLAAPGEALIAPYPGGRYAAVWGTSFSAALVSGTVGLMTQVAASLNWEDAGEALEEAAPVAGDLGNGRLDAYRAVRKAMGWQEGGSAPSGDGVCRGSLTGFLDNVTVPEGASCSLWDARVKGNVKVYRGGRLTVSGQTSIGGNLQSDDEGGYVRVTGPGVVIGGNVQIKKAHEASAIQAGTEVRGNFEYEENSGFLSVEGLFLHGDFKLSKNTGGAVLTNNAISKKMECKENSPAPSGAGNRAGVKEGQCAGL